MKKLFTLNEIVFISIMSCVFGIAWWVYGLLYEVISPFLRPLCMEGLLWGIWQIGGIFFAYVIRKPGSALFGEVMASTIQCMLSQWGFLSILGGISQGIMTELVFISSGYKNFTVRFVLLSGIVSSIGGYIVTYFWFHYSAFGLAFNLGNLSGAMISGALLGGLLAIYLANKLNKTGVLNQFKINHIK